MKISKQARRDAKALFQSCKVDGIPDAGRVRSAVSQVIEKKPRGYVAILGYFHRLLKLDSARRTAVVESPTPLPAALQETLKSNLARRHGAGLEISFIQNPALIGGLRVRVGSDVYDGSVQARLATLEANL